MAIHINSIIGGDIFVTLADGGDGNWKFGLEDFPETIEFHQFPGSNSENYTQICPSQDETRLLVAFGSTCKAHIGTWSNFDPTTYSKTAESVGIQAGSTLYTPDGLHYLTQNFNTTGVYMYEGTIPYDVTTISGTKTSSKAIQGISNVNGSSISRDGLHVLSYANNSLVSLDLSTPFDLSTADNQRDYRIGTIATEIFVNQNNGKQILCVKTSSNTSGGTIMLITLDTAWDATSVKKVDYISPNISVDGVTYTSEKFLRGVAVNNAGNKVVLMGSSMNKSSPMPTRNKAYAALVDFN